MDRQALIQRIFDTLSVEPDYPWFDAPDAAVFRHAESRKWFALLMRVSPRSLRLPGDAPVDILNVKCDPILAGSLRQRPGFLPAYHMNKDQWISIVLDAVPEDEILSLVCASFELTQKPKPRTRRAARSRASTNQEGECP